LKTETNWVSPPPTIGGLDHLGTQAPCLMIYAQLLPGITNVTDRARYYSFYTWLIWSYDQQFPKDDPAHFVEFFRRADCLFTLISERHSRMTDQDNERHGAAMVGREKLVQALSRLEEGVALKLSHFTAQDSPQRYFKNPMGGLSQYYAGTLRDLGIFDLSEKPWIKYTTEHGAPLAKAVDSSVSGAKFWTVVRNDKVTLDDLDALDRFCACQLASATDECKNLTDIYFDRCDRYAEDGVQRRLSLALILQLVSSLPSGFDLSEAAFRACVYSGVLPKGEKWEVPDVLCPTAAHWALYVRNDLFSITCQTILALSLRELEPQGAANHSAFDSIESFAQHFSSRKAIAGVAKELRASTFGLLLDRLATAAPPIAAVEEPAHELQLAERMRRAWSLGESPEVLLELALSVLAMLSIRDDLSRPPYHGLAILPDALVDYPINLASFRERVAIWRPLTVQQVIADLVTWCLNTHLRVALRKLRQTGRSTFQVRPSERGLEVVCTEIPAPSPTTPRFRQAVQILRDIGALGRDSATDNRQTVLSELGLSLMEETCG